MFRSTFCRGRAVSGVMLAGKVAFPFHLRRERQTREQRILLPLSSFPGGRHTLPRERPGKMPQKISKRSAADRKETRLSAKRLSETMKESGGHRHSLYRIRHSLRRK